VDSRNGQRETEDGSANEGGWKYDWDNYGEENGAVEEVQGELGVEEEESFEILEDPVVA
jgi:hypothetical protein